MTLEEAAISSPSHEFRTVDKPRSSRQSVADFLCEAPVASVVVLCLLQVACWTLGPSLATSNPPLDVVEGLMWGREWVVMTYKHPQLPPWLLELSFLLTGSIGWPQFLLAQVSVAATFLVVFFFARDLFDSRTALASVLLMPTIYFFNWISQQYNHDTAQIPFWAAIAWTLWRACASNRPVWWVALGLAAGLGMHAKLSTGILIAFGAIWILADRQSRSTLRTVWPWVGFAIFAAIVSPLVIALVRLNFMPLVYMADRNGWVLTHRSRFYYAETQLLALAGLLVAAASCGLFAAKSAVGSDRRLVTPRRTRAYLLWIGCGPAALILIASLFIGVGEAWGTPMYNLAGVLVVVASGRVVSGPVLRRLAVWATAAIVATSSAYAGARIYDRDVKGRLQNTLWPARQMTERFQALWDESTGAPLRVVGGDNWVAMLVGIGGRDHPSIFTDLDFAHAPWITPARIHTEGMLLVWRDSSPPPEGWTEGRIPQSIDINWSAKGRPIRINYLVIPPGGSGAPPGAGSSRQGPAP